MLFSLASFNAHWGVGRFGDARNVRFDVARVVEGFDAEIVVVAESWRGPDGAGSLDPLFDRGYHVETIEFMPLKLRPSNRNALRDAVPKLGLWELAVASRFPVLGKRVLPLGAVKGDPAGARNALAVTVDIGGTAVEVIGLHTSSKVWRLAPLRHLAALKRGLGADSPQILAGDFNFWGPPIGVLMRGWERPVRGRTYPSKRPHSQIDHVLVRGGVTAVSGEVLAPTPSDHIPIRTRLRVDDGVT